MDKIMRGEGEERGPAETPLHSSTMLKKGHLIEDEEENFQASVASWPWFRPHNSKGADKIVLW